MPRHFSLRESLGMTGRMIMKKARPPRNRKKTAKYRAKKKLRVRRRKARSVHARKMK